MIAFRRVLRKYNRRIWRNVLCKHSCSHVSAIAEYEPVYPPIIDMSKEGQRRYNRQLFYDKLQALPTVEQKLHAIIENKRTYYSRTYIMSSCPSSYLGTPFHQYVTRTHIIQNLPEKFQATNIDAEYDSIKLQLCSTVVKHMTNVWRENKLMDIQSFFCEKECGSKLANELLIHICRATGLKNPHLLSAAFDPRPHVHSFWWHGGFECRKNSKFDRSDICFQFTDYPYFTIRIDKPLVPVVPLDDPLSSTAEVIDYNYHPRFYGSPYNRRFLTCFTGVWPGDVCGFPLLQVHTADRVNKLTDNLDHYNHRNVEEAYGVMASFGWLNALATYQGFTSYHDITYPIVGQTILTNGQDWTFFLYQLNTIAFHSDVDKKDRRNLCWISPKMRLFETIEDGELKGLNEEVFKMLFKFTVNTPIDVTDTLNLSPYLGHDTRTEDEITEMRAEWKKLCRNVRIPAENSSEIPMWHQVYKRHPDAPPSPAVRLI